MTEHSKIPLPKDGEKPVKDGSLFERASGAFGFDAFRAAPMPAKLEDAPMKRARVRKPVPEEEKSPPQKVAGEIVSEPVEEPRAETLPVPVAPPPVPATVEAEKVAFSGPRHAIDRAHLRDRGLIDPEGTTSGLVEEFRIVKRQLLGDAREAGTPLARRILVCSPHPGEGKTFCATNLAIALAAERDSEVVLVDADFAKPSILSTLGLPKARGLMDALADDSLRVEELVLGTDVPGLWVLPAGERTNADSEYLASSRTGEVLDRLTAGAPSRILIFDTPPALAASPAAELAKHVGQAVLIARADETGRTALEDAVDLLSACPDIKLLLNAASFSPSGRRFGTYYGYGG